MSAASASAALRRLEGVWRSSYGPHGVEHLWVGMVGNSERPHGCPVSSERLEGLKVTGDPNVPAGAALLLLVPPIHIHQARAVLQE